ncbi:MAG TPA: OmpH family outer membrane protein [Bacteroidales bacterium]|nr:OmpH family outer membrane protein [Bacteroidales bacterium]
MKKIVLLLSMFLLTGVFSAIQAQSKGKIGHIDSGKLLSLMPDREKAQNDLQAYSKQLEDQLTAMQTELQKKYNDYLSKKDSLSDILLQTREKELQDLQTRIQNFQVSAQQDLQKKEQELLQPIIEKAREAIRKVAKSKGYSYVLDSSSGALLFWPENSDDLLPLVKTELGL